MQRSHSWPKLETSVEDEVESRDCSTDLPVVADSLQYKETVCECENQYRGLVARAEQMEMENQYLISENENLKHECNSNAEREKLLERDRNALRLQIRELECFLTDLQNIYEKAERDKITVTEELSRQISGFMELECSKKDLEAQVQKLQASSEWKRQEEDERVRELIQENDILRGELQEMEHHLQAKELEVQNAQLLRAENHEMENQISQMVQQNIYLRRQFNEVTQTKECLEKKYEALRNEMQSLKIESRNSREALSSIQYAAHDLDPEHDWSDEDVRQNPDKNDDVASTGSVGVASTCSVDVGSIGSVVNCAVKIIPAGNNPARTPPPVSLAEEFHLSVCNSESTNEDNQETDSHDALDEFHHLTAAAVKIYFHMVPISSDELIERAKNIPFYRVHDELTRYMQEKLQEQENSLLPKHKREDTQEQIPAYRKVGRVSLLRKWGSSADVRRHFSAHKHKIMKFTTFTGKEEIERTIQEPAVQHSVVNKVFRRLFRTRSI